LQPLNPNFFPQSLLHTHLPVVLQALNSLQLCSHSPNFSHLLFDLQSLNSLQVFIPQSPLLLHLLFHLQVLNTLQLFPHIPLFLMLALHRQLLNSLLVPVFSFNLSFPFFSALQETLFYSHPAFSLRVVNTQRSAPSPSSLVGVVVPCPKCMEAWV
jgi:hypothetical protein